MRILFALCLLLNFLPSKAASIEQPLGGGIAGIFFFEPIGQSFVANQNILKSVAFSFIGTNTNPTGDGVVTMSIYQGDGLEGKLLGSTAMNIDFATLPIEPVPYSLVNLLDFDFSGIELQIGRIYTAAVESDDQSIFVEVETADVYSPGQLYQSSGSELFQCSTVGCDMTFRVTTVPVPAAAWLFVSSLAGLAFWRRKRAFS